MCRYFLRMPELPHAYTSVLGTSYICRKNKQIMKSVENLIIVNTIAIIYYKSKFHVSVYNQDAHHWYGTVTVWK